MSVRVMTAVWALDLPDSQKIVLLALADCANDEGHCWPSMRSLKMKCSKSERTIQGVIKQLVETGHVTRNEVLGKGCDYLVHPRKDCAPQPLRPRTRRTPPPQRLRETPAAAADKPSLNHQEPSKTEPSGSDPPADDFTFEDFFESWNETAARYGLPLMPRPLPRRRKAFAVRKREYPDIADWRRAFDTLAKATWMHGDNKTGWRADPDFFLQPKSFTKLVEGSYGQAH